MILGSKVCRSFLLLVFAVLVGGAVHYALSVEVYFTQMYFVSDRSKINQWFTANEKYFQPGGEDTITYIYDNTILGIDFSEIEAQNKVHTLNEAIQDCNGCDQPWH